MEKMIPLSIPNFEGNEKKYVEEAVEQGWVSTGGEFVTRLEENMAEYLHTVKVAACQSGTAAIHLSLIECGVGPNDMVIVPTATFIAAVNPVRYQFAEPVFIDCDDSVCIDPEKVREFCEKECTFLGDKLMCKRNGKQVKAIIAVHVFGNLCDMEKIMEIAEKYQLKVIEDATEALGTKYTEGKYAGKYAGTIGDFGAYSFNGNKIITTGGGGAVTAKDAKAVRHMQYLSTQAKDEPNYFIHNEVGYNYRMTNVQAAIGVAQLEQLDTFIERKQKNYKLYQEQLDGFKHGELMKFREGTDSNHWFYAFKITTQYLRGDLRDLILGLKDAGIQTRAMWAPIHEQKPYSKCMTYKIQWASYYSKHIINLPCSTQITEEEISYTAQQIKNVLTSMEE